MGFVKEREYYHLLSLTSEMIQEGRRFRNTDYNDYNSESPPFSLTVVFVQSRLKGSHKSKQSRIPPPVEDHIILQFGVMRLSCDRRDIYVQIIWIQGENPCGVSSLG